MTDRQFEAARQYTWLRTAYFHHEMVNRVLGAPDVASDPNITVTTRTGNRDLESPDAVVGDELPLDVIPDTPVSRQAHLGRSGITDPQQLLTYEPATHGFLDDIFGAESASGDPY